jgi:phosphopantothenoylcysteine decarboxylase/phosphopantothenate--cysteine ligase
LQPPTGVEIVGVETAAEMHDAVMTRRGEATVVIKAAAVADYRPKVVSAQKMKRHAEFALELVPTSDIAAELGDRKQGQLLIGFAAETENVLENARQKLLAKGLDAIVANDVSQPGVGFDSDRNAVTIITPTEVLDVPASTKWDVAQKILDTVRKIREQRPAKVRS